MLFQDLYYYFQFQTKGNEYINKKLRHRFTFSILKQIIAQTSI